MQSLPGHRDAISGLAFRQGTHDLYSCAFDRTLKLWSCDDCTYVDTLFGHQVHHPISLGPVGAIQPALTAPAAYTSAAAS